MQLSDFNYHLPEELIARYPKAERSASKLLCLESGTGRVEHRVFSTLPELLGPKDLLVFNDTRVIPARLFGHKETGGKVEILLERVLNDYEALAQIRASKAIRPGGRILIAGQLSLEVKGRSDEFYHIVASDKLAVLLERHGHMPLPPYIDRADEASDQERYQTVYARNPGAVAAPTAGLHFDQPLLEAIAGQGVKMAKVTLHVGAGTFQPVRVANIEQHKMHKERVEVSREVCEQVMATKSSGGRVIAVGTTSVRSLETAAQQAEKKGEQMAPWQGESDIFIYPGYRFRCVDAMITNFHLPESSLLMLVSAFATREMIMSAYQQAIDHRYRFFSYGDAMFIARSVFDTKSGGITV